MLNFPEKLKNTLKRVPPAEQVGAVCNVASELFPLALAHFVLHAPAEISTLIIAEQISEAERIREDLEAWLKLLGKETTVHLLPELEQAQRRIVPEHECERSRIFDLSGKPGQVFVASAVAVAAPAPPPDSFRDAYLSLRPGNMEWPPQKLAEYLTDLDYDNEVEVHLPGEYSWRGGILDIFSPVYEFPIRLDYFGDELESIRFFSPESQRSLEGAEECLIIPRGETAMRRQEDQNYSFVDYFDLDRLQVSFCQPEQLEAHLERFADDSWLERYNRIGDGRFPLLLLSDDDMIAATSRIHAFPMAELFESGSPETVAMEDELRGQLLRSTLERWVKDDYDLAVICSSQSKLDRFAQLIENCEPLRQLNIATALAPISYGALLPDDKLVILTDNEIFGRPAAQRTHRHKNVFHADHMLQSSSELSEGSYAVHALYGVCRYHGLGMEVFNGELQEVLQLEFAGEVTVCVPLEQAHLVGRYTGAGKRLPTLSKVGQTRWKKAKLDAETSIKDLAAELLRMQAMRTTCSGVVAKGDRGMLDSFGDAFPYQETADQLTAIREIHEDMDQLRPMDRLLCGDVGFGKTEVAMRAAFKAVLGGKQVAVLVPTTILCQQHLMSFRERFREFPVLIDELSRFRTAGEQKKTLQALEDGRLDIVIGTHRLISGDIRFKDLGLMIIDEEQRFGVKAKERLKQLRLDVDVLTMTATPIPRTLYLSMSGLRDMSTIITPPLERLPVQTIVAQFSTELIREVILREIQREGQVYFLHNRVQTINEFAKQIKGLVPEANVDIGHGQMSEHDLEEVMLRFMKGDTNVLVCSTIIESGLDIPNANTIIIDRADRFGLAELYQLRGRVGRYHRQAYAYLLIPQRAALLDSAKQRLNAIRKYTQLGAGFKLALRDLEIRGAGNILGKEQSGHIAAIGFDLYCQLLREAVSRLKGENPQQRPQVAFICDWLIFSERIVEGKIAACLPRNYINDEGTRVQCYRKLSGFSTPEEVDEYTQELQDRFGRIPPQAHNFLLVTRIKVLAARKSIHSISIRKQKVYLEGHGGFRKTNQRIPVLQSADIHDYLSELNRLLETV